MGLIELLIRIEERFGIRISDNDVSKLVTVEDLLRLVNKKLKAAVSVNCPTAYVFRLLSKHLREQLPSEAPKRIWPGDSLLSLLPRQRRIEFWHSMEESSDFRLPGLRRYLWLDLITYTGVIGIAIALSCQNWNAGGLFQPFTFILLAILFCIFYFFASNRLETKLPAETVGELARAIASRNAGVVNANHQGEFAVEDVWVNLRSLVADVAVVPESKVQLSSQLVSGLDLDD